MERSLYVPRFFRVVSPVSRMIGWTFLVIVSVSALLVWLDSSKAAAAMQPVLLMQLFAASSGFAVPARRGHYDLLLTRGENRVWIALVHWLMSVLPGVVAWLIVAGVELAVARARGDGTRTSLLMSGTCVAMCLVSTLPWAITVRLPRFSGGIGWLLALSMSAMLWSSMPTFAAAGESLDLQTRAWAAWSFLVYPAGLVGSDLSGDQALAAAPALTLAVASMIDACRWIARSSIPLEAAQ